MVGQLFTAILEGYEVCLEHTAVKVVHIRSLNRPRLIGIREGTIDDMRSAKLNVFITEQDGAIEVREGAAGYGRVISPQQIEYLFHG